ncbi:MAG: VWA domain-containing protein [Pseudomonadota bacterium]
MLLRKLLFTLALLATLMLSPVQAQQGQGDPARDIRVVVDISGSMKLNDPDNLRRPAVRLLAGLLPDDTGVGLWTFGREVNMLVSHGPLDDDQRQALNEGSEQINSIAQRTNIGGAIENAGDEWYAPGRSLANTHIILLSDGKVDIDPSAARNDRERERILQELVPELASRGLTIHTIALSAEADLDLLGAIADLTGGVAHVAESADELSRIFADTLGQAAPANEIPLDNNRFTVDQGVEEFTALIFSNTAPGDRQLTLLAPDGARSEPDSTGDGVRWAREAGYDLITVGQPAAGKWQLEGTLGEGSRVTVVSDLRLEVNPIPARFSATDTVELEAFFSEEGERITDADFLRVIDVHLTMTTGDGRQGTRTLSEEQPPADGIYRDTISRLQQPGQYQLELEADGGTFSRKFRQTLVLVPSEEDGQGPALDIPVETVPEPAPAEEPAPAADGPVDLSLVEVTPPEPEEDAVEPQPQPESSDDDRSLKSSWPWIAAGAGLLLLLLAIILLVLRRKRHASAAAVADVDSDQTSGAESEKTEPENAAGVEPMVAPEESGQAGISPDAEASAGALPDEEPQPDTLAEPDENDTPAAPAASGEEPPAAEEPEPAEDLQVSDLDQDAVLPEEDGTDEVPEITDTPQTAAEPETDSAGEASREDDPGLDDFDDSLLEEEDGDEFGLEDFDLSDIDDLPDLDAEEDENTRRQKPSEDEGRKDG